MQLDNMSVKMNKKNNFFKVLMFVLECADGIIVSLLIAAASVSLLGCQPLSGKWDSTDYTVAKELPPLKLPPDSLALSKRYDIPDISGNKDLIVSNNMPPDYY